MFFHLKPHQLVPNHPVSLNYLHRWHVYLDAEEKQAHSASHSVDYYQNS